MHITQIVSDLQENVVDDSNIAFTVQEVPLLGAVAPHVPRRVDPRFKVVDPSGLVFQQRFRSTKVRPRELLRCVCRFESRDIGTTAVDRVAGGKVLFSPGAIP